MTEREIYERAKKKVNAKKGFFVHFTCYAIFTIFLFTLNMRTSPEFWWSLFPILGWGMGVVGHYTNVFGLPFAGGDWEEKELEKEMKKLEKRAGYQPRENYDDDITVPDDELELKEFKKLRKEWDDQDFV